MSPQNNRPQAGDFTGREKAQQAKDAAQELSQRETEMSMATAYQDEEERVGVYDPQSGDLLPDEDQDEAAFLVRQPPFAPPAPTEPEPQFGPQPAFFHGDEPTLTGRESDEEVAVILAQQKQRPKGGRGRAVALNPIVRVRVDQDVDKMTYGMINNEPNNYNLKEGLQYELPREVAEHLDERGLIRAWIRS